MLHLIPMARVFTCPWSGTPAESCKESFGRRTLFDHLRKEHLQSARQARSAISRLTDSQEKLGRGKYAIPVKFAAFWEDNPDLGESVLRSVYSLYGTIEGCYLAECQAPNCGKVFWMKRGSQRYCSAVCRKRAWSTVDRTPAPARAPSVHCMTVSRLPNSAVQGSFYGDVGGENGKV